MKKEIKVEKETPSPSSFLFIDESGEPTKKDRLADSWLSIEEASSYLSVSQDTLRGWIKKSEQTEIPAYRIGKMWRLKISELDDWVKKNHLS